MFILQKISTTSWFFNKKYWTPYLETCLYMSEPVVMLSDLIKMFGRGHPAPDAAGSGRPSWALTYLCGAGICEVAVKCCACSRHNTVPLSSMLASVVIVKVVLGGINSIPWDRCHLPDHQGQDPLWQTSEDATCGLCGSNAALGTTRWKACEGEHIPLTAACM